MSLIEKLLGIEAKEKNLELYGDSLGLSRDKQTELRNRVDDGISGKIPVEQVLTGIDVKKLNSDAFVKCKELFEITNNIEKLYGQNEANKIRIPLKEVIHNFREIFD